MRTLLAAAILAAPASLVAQVVATANPAPRPGSPAAPVGSVTATRAERAPVIDGRTDDAAWQLAMPITGFRQNDPVEDGEPTYPTEARITYDEANVYILVRAFDPHPDSIISLLSRRDVRTPSDQIKVMIDSYHDRRTGYEFAVNPAGVKRDYYTFNDGEEDGSWDAVWDVATAIDSLGWVAEYRIPLSQLRYPRAESNTFGISIWRDIARRNERSSWPAFYRTRPGIASQFAPVPGFTGLGAPRRLEVAPYMVAKNATSGDADVGYDRVNKSTIGADVKYGLTSNLTLDATVNPDFGQVEADPSVLNLTAFETFFQEKRPFFLEGTGIFRFDLNCNDGVCSGLFYSRRIGRAPQLHDGDASTPNATRILGAAKVTGRLKSGTSVGILNAMTQTERGLGDAVVEPQTNYFVGRVQQDFRKGESGIGAMVTAVGRRLDETTDDYLRSGAYSGGVDFRHRFLKNRWEVSGYAAMSRVEGSREAIAATQLCCVHNYARADRNRFDSTRTSLTGSALQLSVNKVSGFVRMNSSFQRIGEGFEINDLGFLERDDQMGLYNWVGLQYTQPKHFYRRAFVNFNQWNQYTTDGLRLGVGGNVNAHAEFRNSWWGHWGLGVDAPAYCDRNCTRGGPALRTSGAIFGWDGIEGDPRMRVTPFLFNSWSRGDGGRSWRWSLDPSVDIRVRSGFQASVGAGYSRRVADAQWRPNDTASTTEGLYTFAKLDQNVFSLTTRLDYTATPNLSLQVYAAPFIAVGDYSDWRQLGDPRAERYEDRFVPYAGHEATDPGRLRYRAFQSNTVLRWEYRPGSVLFLVWSQGRSEYDDLLDAGRFRTGREMRGLYGLHPDNTFLVKASYWLSL